MGILIIYIQVSYFAGRPVQADIAPIAQLCGIRDVMRNTRDRHFSDHPRRPTPGMDSLPRLYTHVNRRHMERNGADDESLVIPLFWRQTAEYQLLQVRRTAPHSFQHRFLRMPWDRLRTML
ncbi:hypothetical protein PSPO01_06544 [Paraphaeosphaeria sporulosa]